MNERIKGLDGLRAVAIVWVMLFHSWVVGGLGNWDGLAKPGWMGVDLFFVLSGFLIGSQVFAPLAGGARFSYADFYTRRAFRILPAFLVVLALYLALPPIREADGMPPTWMFLTFTQNLFVDYANDKAFSHVWSLCVEEHFYLVFPTLALLLARRRTRAIAAFALIVVFGGMALRAGIWMQLLAPLRDVPDASPGFGTRWIEWVYYPTWCRLDGLLFGVLLAAVRTWKASWWQAIERRNGVVAVAGIACLALSILVSVERNGVMASVVGFPLVALSMALLVAAGAAPRGWISRLTPPGAGWLAAASYSLYLTHKAVYAVVDHALPESAQGVARFVVIGVAALVAGAVLHYAVERPGLRLRRRLVRDRRALPDGAPEAA